MIENTMLVLGQEANWRRRTNSFVEAPMEAAKDPLTDDKDMTTVAPSEEDEVPSARTIRNEGHAKLDSAMSELGVARRKHELLRFVASVMGALLAWWLLHASLTGSGDVPKLEEAFGSALLFASIAGIATTLVRLVSRVGKREIAVLQRDSELRRQESQLLSIEFDRIHNIRTGSRVR